MSLAAGTKLGSYEILAPLGSGGMGDVYRARDPQLGREVAIKVLPPAVAEEEQRLSRFRREARLLASLNHPNIATLHGLEHGDGTHFLVMELVSGETLADRLAPRPLRVANALPIFVQIARALEAAHDKGIVHRDLKPANVMITRGEDVKVLDFGLAKALAEPGAEPDTREHSTITRAETELGVVLGTPMYMSPEQARGDAVDARTDLWAFGCVLFEALTGSPPFAGRTVSDTIARTLEREPDWSALPAETPEVVRSLLHRCLQKKAERRLRDAWGVRVELEQLLDSPPAKSSPTSRGRWAAVMGVLTAGAVAALAVSRLVRVNDVEPSNVTRTAIPLADDAPLADGPATMALSPDGRRIAYVGSAEGTTQLFVRAMDRFDVRPIDGTEGARIPFFSPDGRWVGFSAGGTLKKVSLDGGEPQILCDTNANQGASWGGDGRIVFAPALSRSVWSVPASGGTPEVLFETAHGETALWPEFPPGDEWVLVTVATASGFENTEILVVSTLTGESRSIVTRGSGARYLPSGHIVFGHAGALMAARFDPDTRELLGKSVTVLEGVRFGAGVPFVHFSLSRDGSLAYLPARGPPSTSIVWIDREGRVEPIALEPRTYALPSLSPDGTRLALTTLDAARMETWILDLARGALSRFTFEGNNHLPIWAPDGRRIVFSSARDGPPNLFWKLSDGSGAAARLVTSTRHQDAGSFSPDGRMLAFVEARTRTNMDVWLLHLADEPRAELFLSSEFSEFHPMISPDGRWLAYTSDESGRREVYVQPFPGGGGKVQISTAGGSEPVWARSGRELFYRNDDAVMAVAIALDAGTRPRRREAAGALRAPRGREHRFRRPELRRQPRRRTLSHGPKRSRGAPAGDSAGAKLGRGARTTPSEPVTPRDAIRSEARPSDRRAKRDAPGRRARAPPPAGEFRRLRDTPTGRSR